LTCIILLGTSFTKNISLSLNLEYFKLNSSFGHITEFKENKRKLNLYNIFDLYLILYNQISFIEFYFEPVFCLDITLFVSGDTGKNDK